MQEKPEVSIVIVNYKVKKELFTCLSSLKKYWPKVPTEVIVLDNDEIKIIENELRNKFPWVKYIKSPGNIGFGAGNNFGAKEAIGKYFFFLNPDTVFVTSAVDLLVEYLKTHKKTGIVAPLLLDRAREPYALQGTSRLGFWEGIIALSFLNKLFPTNPISRKYWHLDSDKTAEREVDVVPGTAFVIRRELFNKIKGFDDRFFLYFEEFDLCNRVKAEGFSLSIFPNAKIIHGWGASSKSNSNIEKIFRESRFLYFQKYYGYFRALLVHFFLSLRKEHFVNRIWKRTLSNFS